MSANSKQIYPDPFANDELLGPVETLDGRISVQEEKRSVQGSGSSVKKVMGSGTPFGMDNRDPNNLNPHLQIMWDDIVGEPEGLRTPESCWNCSWKCYNGSRRCCYVLLVVLFGPIIALINGWNFACLSFNQVWCIGPCYRLYKINMATVRRFLETFLMACMAPCVAVSGLIFSNIKIRHMKLDDGPDVTPEDHFNV